MDIKKAVSNNRTISKVSAKAYKAAPTIAFVAGAIGSVASLYLMWRAARKHEEVVSDAIDIIEEVHDKKPDEKGENENALPMKDYRKELVKAYIKAGFKIGKLYILQGNKATEVSELHAGDLGALQKLDIATGDTLSTKANPVQYAKMDISQPYTYMRYHAQNKADIDKIAQSLAKLSAEDQTLKVVNDAENRQTLLYGMGDMHLEVVQSKQYSQAFPGEHGAVIG